MINIRTATHADTQQIKDLISTIMHNEYPDSDKFYTLHDLDDPVGYYNGEKDVFLVAEKDDSIVGTVAIKEDSDSTALLRRVFVKREYRGRGYGERLLSKAMEFCFAHDYSEVVFRGVDRMQKALQLCLKKGFEEKDLLVTDDIKMFVLTKHLPRTAVRHTIVS